MGTKIVNRSAALTLLAAVIGLAGCCTAGHGSAYQAPADRASADRGRAQPLVRDPEGDPACARPDDHDRHCSEAR